MDIREMKRAIKEYDEKRPFVFISYSSKDSEKVYEDILELQSRGVNLWIDKEMETRAGEGWKEIAFPIMEKPFCKAILYYLSLNSITSGPVKQELAHRHAQKTIQRNGNKVLKMIPIAIDNIIDMRKWVFEDILYLCEDGKIEENEYDTACDIFRDQFNENNDITRIARPDMDFDDYYVQIVENIINIDQRIVNSERKKVIDSSLQEQKQEPKQEQKNLASQPVTIASARGIDTKIKVTPKAGVKTLHDMLYALMESIGEYSYRYTNATNPEDKKKYKPDGDNWLYNMVNKEIPPFINSVDFLSDEKYYCKAGCGNGNWATCPWIAVFNLYITSSTTEGIYIVYLLDREKKELYLTLNQGMTSITKMVDEEIRIKGRQYIKELGYRSKGEYISAILRDTATKIRKEIGIGPFSDEDISTNVWQYDVGCICSKKYTLASLPSDEVLLNDLADMLKLYDTYFEKHREEYQMKDISKKGKKTN